MNSPDCGVAQAILLYACGGGIGHFNRAYALGCALLKHQLKPQILCSTPLRPPLTVALPVWQFPPLAWASDSAPRRGFLNSLQPQVLVVDTFPTGHQDELLPLLQRVPTRLLIARDPVSPAAQAHYTRVVSPVPGALGYMLNSQPQELFSFSQARQMLRAPQDRPLILAVHNGEPTETLSFFEVLVRTLKDSPYTLRLASLLPLLKPEWATYWVSQYPLSRVYSGVDLLIGGGGYNLVAEAQAFGLRALHCAFRRPVDNQWQRIQGLHHFKTATSPQALRSQIERLLAAAPPSPLSAEDCQGAQKVADWIKAEVEI